MKVNQLFMPNSAKIILFVCIQSSPSYVPIRNVKVDIKKKKKKKKMMKKNSG
jgi:hypothetical protein